ncbi:NADH-quinone oxidoreductase subunit NuoE family protein [Baekduia soli]|nr:NAD(P)H-dependent oxidoreductase subunit E [Baekduia soli]
MEVRRFAQGSRIPGWDDSVDLAKDPQEIPDPATTPVPASLREEIEHHMAKYPDRRSAAIPALAAAQRLHGWCSPEAVGQVACVMRLTPAYLVAVASFYDMLDTRPVGHRRVYVCTNISCSLRGGRELLGRLKDAVGEDPDVQVRGFECLGACDIAPMVSVDGIYVGPVADDEVDLLAAQIRDGEDPLPAKQLLSRPSADPQANTREWDRPGTDFAQVESELQRPAPGSDPLPPEPSSFGPPMGEPVHPGDAGPPAPLEQAPTPPDGPSQEDGTP